MRQRTPSPSGEGRYAFNLLQNNKIWTNTEDKLRVMAPISHGTEAEDIGQSISDIDVACLSEVVERNMSKKRGSDANDTDREDAPKGPIDRGRPGLSGGAERRFRDGSPVQSHTSSESGREHIERGDKLIEQGKIEEALAEYHQALKLLLKSAAGSAG